MFIDKPGRRSLVGLGVILALLLTLVAACTETVEVPGETVIVEKEVIKEVEVPGETVIVEKEVIKEVEKIVEVIATAVPEMQEPGFVLRALEANPKRGGIFREAIPVSLNAFDVLQGGGIHIIAPVYNKLVQRNVMDGLRTIVPDLVQSWESTSDAKGFTLNLRQMVTYHDGTPFNADDAMANMNRIIDPPEGVTSALKDTLTAVDSVDKVDDYTVKFSLNNSTPYFLEILVAGNMVMYSDEELDANDGDLRRLEIPTGTGPFMFEDHAPDERWKLRSNTDYFVPGLPYLDGVDVVHAVTWPERGTAVLTGQADYSFNVSRGTWDEGQKRADISVAETPCLWSHNVAFNNEKPPFDDPKVRKAIHLAVSRQVQIEGYRPVWEPTFVTCWIPVPSPYATGLGQIATLPGYRPDKTEDIETARALMAEAGYPDGFKTEIVTWNGAPTAEVATPLFVDMLNKALKIDAEIKVIERFTGGEILASGDYELDRGYSFGGSLLDPYLMWNSFFRTGANQNWSRYSNADLDAVLDKLAGELDPIKRQELFNQGMDIMDEDPPVYHIGFCAWSPMWYNYVKGLNLQIRSLGSNTDSWETTWLDK